MTTRVASATYRRMVMLLLDCSRRYRSTDIPPWLTGSDFSPSVQEELRQISHILKNVVAPSDDAQRANEKAHALERQPMSDHQRMLNESTLQCALIDWFESITQRWMGRPDLALPQALRAADTFAQVSAQNPLARLARERYGRLQPIVAETALDLLTSYPTTAPHHGRDAMLDLALPYVRRGITLADGESDPEGEIMALLARVRFDRITQPDTDNTRAIATALQRAAQLDDIALLAQASTALGEELAARGEMESALNSYRKTLDIVRHTDATAMGVWAQRALIAASRDA